MPRNSPVSWLQTRNLRHPKKQTHICITCSSATLRSLTSFPASSSRPGQLQACRFVALSCPQRRGRTLRREVAERRHTRPLLLVAFLLLVLRLGALGSFLLLLVRHLLLEVMHLFLVASLFLVIRPGAPNVASLLRS